jgi:hypothetical protein
MQGGAAMKILLISTLTRLRLPGRKLGSDELINPELRDSVRLCYDVCDENRELLTAPVGRYDSGGYVEHSEEAALRLKLQQVLGPKKLGVASYPMPDGLRVRFEAIRVFPCGVEVEI